MAMVAAAAASLATNMTSSPRCLTVCPPLAATMSSERFSKPDTKSNNSPTDTSEARAEYPTMSTNPTASRRSDGLPWTWVACKR